MYCVVVVHFFEKKCRKKFGNGALIVSIFAAAIRNRCVEQTEEVRGYDGLVYRFLCCAVVLQDIALVGF